jgi:hypothetical protein
MKETCTATQEYRLESLRSDVLVLACDLPAGHQTKKHHDPTRDVEWYGTKT